MICGSSQCSQENVCAFSDSLSDLVMYYFYLKQENVHECTKICIIRGHVLLRIIPDVRYSIPTYVSGVIREVATALSTQIKHTIATTKHSIATVFFVAIVRNYIIVRLQNTGIYVIYNPKALSCGAQAKRGRY